MTKSILSKTAAWVKVRQLVNFDQSPICIGWYLWGRICCIEFSQESPTNQYTSWVMLFLRLLSGYSLSWCQATYDWHRSVWPSGKCGHISRLTHSVPCWFQTRVGLIKKSCAAPMADMSGDEPNCTLVLKSCRANDWEWLQKSTVPFWASKLYELTLL